MSSETNITILFEPIALIEKMHNFPHLNNQLHRINGNFDVHDLSVESLHHNPYISSLFVLPTILMFLLLFLLFCFPFFTIAYHYIFNQTSPGALNTQNAFNVSDYRKFPFRILLSSSLYIMLFVLFIFMNIIWFGNSSFGIGYKLVSNSFNYVTNLCYQLQSYYPQLFTEGIAVNNLIDIIVNISQNSTNPCFDPRIVQFLNAKVVEFNNDVDLLIQLTETISQSTNAGLKNFHYGSNVKNGSIWITYIVFCCCIMIMISQLFWKFDFIEKYGRISLYIFGIGLLIFGCLLLGSLVGIADFCMNPINNLSMITSTNDITLSFTSYYLTCAGTNPFTPSLIDAYQSIKELYNFFVVSLQIPVCSSNVYLEQGKNITSIMLETLVSMENITNCNPIQIQLYDGISNGICVNGYTGYFLLWLWEYISTICLIFCIILIQVISVYPISYTNNTPIAYLSPLIENSDPTQI